MAAWQQCSAEEDTRVQVRRKGGAKPGGRLLNFGKAKASTANVRKVGASLLRLHAPSPGRSCRAWLCSTL